MRGGVALVEGGLELLPGGDCDFRVSDSFAIESDFSEPLSDLLSSLSSSSEDGGSTSGSCTATWSEEVGIGGFAGGRLGRNGNEDSSKVISVDTLIVRVLRSQSL